MYIYIYIPRHYSLGVSTFDSLNQLGRLYKIYIHLKII